MATEPKDEKGRWERNERVRRLALERDHDRPANEGGVEFVLIGGFAVGMHGAVRATKDVDVVPEPEPGNLERLAIVVRSIEGRQIGVDTEFLPHQPTDAAGLAAGGSFQLATVHGQLDILQEGAAIPPYGELAGAALELWRQAASA